MPTRPTAGQPGPGSAGPRCARPRRILESLVVPAFGELAAKAGNDDIRCFLKDSPTEVRGTLGGGHPLHVTAEPVDAGHARLRFGFPAGLFVGNVPVQAMLVGHLLATTPFHIRPDHLLGRCGRLKVCCDLVVCDGDEPLVRRTLAETHRLCDDLDWFFPLRMPSRLTPRNVAAFEIPWHELPHRKLLEFLKAGLAAPAPERTPVALVWLALGLARWRDVLRLLREHPVELPAASYAPLKVMALRELGRWQPAVEAAAEGDLRDGRYPGAPWLSPSYMHAFIEAGNDIEALRILGQPVRGEPGFHDWLRGLAFHRAGDCRQADKAFQRYFRRWPGDVIGSMATGKLMPGE